MRRVNCALNAAGMCCAMTTAGLSGGKPISISRIASVPPVEAPTAMMRSVVHNMLLETTAGSIASAEFFGGTDARIGLATRATTRAPAAARIFVRISSLNSASVPATSILGFETKSIAPSSSALSVISAPRSVSDDTITTGMGRSRIRFARNVRPSMRGISTSSVRTSGLVSLMRSRATMGSEAVPTTSMSAAVLRISTRIWRTSAESSTMRTLILRTGMIAFLSYRGAGR